MKFKGVEIKHVPDDKDGLIYHVFGNCRFKDLEDAKRGVEFGLKNYHGDPEVIAARKAKKKARKVIKATEEGRGRSRRGDGMDGFRSMFRF